MKVFLVCSGEGHSNFKVKIGVPKKWQTGPVSKLLAFAVETYNKKNHTALDVDEHHFEAAHETTPDILSPLDNESIIADTIRSRDILHIKRRLVPTVKPADTGWQPIVALQAPNSTTEEAAPAPASKSAAKTPDKTKTPIAEKSKPAKKSPNRTPSPTLELREEEGKKRVEALGKRHAASSNAATEVDAAERERRAGRSQGSEVK